MKFVKTPLLNIIIIIIIIIIKKNFFFSLWSMPDDDLMLIWIPFFSQSFFFKICVILFNEI